MKTLVAMLIIPLLVACGADTIGGAATAAALKKQEMEQGRKAMDQARQRIKAATDQMEQAARRTADSSENN